MILIKILICLLFIIILLQIYDWIKSAMGIKEGMDQVGPPPTTPVPQPLSNTGLSNDPLYLSTINASNIKMLSDQITKIDIDTINNEISSLQTIAPLTLSATRISFPSVQLMFLKTALHAAENR